MKNPLTSLGLEGKRNLLLLCTSTCVGLNIQKECGNENSYLATECPTSALDLANLFFHVFGGFLVVMFVMFFSGLIMIVTHDFFWGESRPTIDRRIDETTIDIYLIVLAVSLFLLLRPALGL